MLIIFHWVKDIHLVYMSCCEPFPRCYNLKMEIVKMIIKMQPLGLQKSYLHVFGSSAQALPFLFSTLLAQGTPSPLKMHFSRRRFFFTRV